MISAIISIVFAVSLILAGIVGWVFNIIALMSMEAVFATGTGILRLVGIFIPFIGAFMVWFG